MLAAQLDNLTHGSPLLALESVEPADFPFEECSPEASRVSANIALASAFVTEPRTEPVQCDLGQFGNEHFTFAHTDLPAWKVARGELTTPFETLREIPDPILAGIVGVRS